MRVYRSAQCNFTGQAVNCTLPLHCNQVQAAVAVLLCFGHKWLARDRFGLQDCCTDDQLQTCRCLCCQVHGAAAGLIVLQTGTSKHNKNRLAQVGRYGLWSASTPEAMYAPVVRALHTIRIGSLQAQLTFNSVAFAGKVQRASAGECISTFTSQPCAGCPLCCAVQFVSMKKSKFSCNWLS